jgi:hypothetical protein
MALSARDLRDVAALLADAPQRLDVERGGGLVAQAAHRRTAAGLAGLAGACAGCGGLISLRPFCQPDRDGVPVLPYAQVTYSPTPRSPSRHHNFFKLVF